ncbi:DUF1570 domain-containing protein [Caulobacter vibrioides]|uniref:DUF1570 domain-containing protein n=2 Tax=Caulobacter vibrioides TaxID=155892 RepID=Q9A9C1_CAUVC|nr:DUF1570 domain-containing protein [Caulobacter vibrioides]YP_002516494.1 MA superfamily peptidase [Caulobacter vibrioides NA1000]AAK23052.1 hypothetical protein CC_1068 [Caulobacter vibrioides CB15]ACL94586.1 MA superfamily peptidase [Caulobacter vibrioides NA1000]ATC27898.1 DUF1570 domain-containing protein [Caulobacter vibrioides]QXZ53147.1 DUF1570 domain-containing protein [Caulobacter vibrioides]
MDWGFVRSMFVRAVLGLVLSLAILGRPSLARAEWQRAESAHFVVYSDGGESGLRAFTAKLEDFDALLRLFHGRAPDQDDTARKLDVYLVRSADQLQRVFPDAESAAGVYTAGPNDIFAVAIRKSTGLADDAVLHEYVHHFMLQHYPGAYPAWLAEGYAEYFMTADIQDKKILVGAPNGARVSNLLNGSWVSARDLLTKRPRALTERQGAMYYGQSWLLTHYMLSDPERKKQLSAFVAATARGEEPLTAWPKTTGVAVDDLERVMRGYLRSAIPNKTLVRDKQPDFPMVVTTLPASAGDLMLENQLAKRGPPKDLGQRLLKTVRADAARYPGDRLASLTLARVEADYGDRAAAETMLADWIAKHPDDAEALRLAGESRLDAAKALKDKPAEAKVLVAEAARFLGRANKAQPDSYQTLYNFAKTRVGEPGYPSDNTLNVLELSAQLAPQVAEIRLATGEALAARGRYADAVRMLEPVANSPHGGKAAEAAATLLKTIMERAATPGE